MRRFLVDVVYGIFATFVFLVLVGFTGGRLTWAQEPSKALPDVRRAVEDYAVSLAAKCYDDANTEITKLKAEIEKLKQPKEEAK
jgi:hypothetical protein